MIQFIFLSILTSLFLFLISLYIESDVIISLSMMLFIVNGVWVLINGIEQINNFLSLVVGMVILSVGMYYFISKGIEQIQEAYGG